MNKFVLTVCVAISVLSLTVGRAQAIPTGVWYEDWPEQDILQVPSFVHELGLQFPQEELIDGEPFTERKGRL